MKPSGSEYSWVPLNCETGAPNLPDSLSPGHMVSCPCCSLYLSHSSYSLSSISILCCGVFVCQAWLPAWYHIPSQAPNMEWQVSAGPSFRFLGESSIKPAQTSYPFWAQAPGPHSHDQWWGSVSSFGFPGVERACLCTSCSLEVTPVCWPRPAHLFLFSIWSLHHCLTFSLCPPHFIFPSLSPSWCFRKVTWYIWWWNTVIGKPRLA